MPSIISYSKHLANSLTKNNCPWSPSPSSKWAIYKKTSQNLKKYKKRKIVQI